MTKKTRNKKYKLTKKQKDSMKGTYVREELLTVYKSGNSKVVTIPAEFPFEVGDILEATYTKQAIKMIKKDNPHKTDKDDWQKEVNELQEKYSLKGKPMSVNEIEEFLEGIYD